MKSIGFYFFFVVVSTALMMSSFIPLRYTTYCNWSLYFYSPNSSSNHIYEEYHPAAYDHYRVAATSQTQTGNRDFWTEFSLNGVKKYIYNAGSWFTYDYNGSSSPTLSMTLKISDGTGGVSMSGNVQVYND